MVYIPGNNGHFKSKNMKYLFLLLASQFLLSQYSYCQNEPADCRQLLDNIGKKLNDRIKTIAAAQKIEKTHLVQLDEWFSELKTIADNNRFGLFAASRSASQGCDRSFEDIFRNFFNSGKKYLFNKARYSTLEECTDNYADELNTPETFGRLKRLSFILHAVYPAPHFNTLNLTEKETYTAFHNYLFSEEYRGTDPNIYAFFYTHLDDIKKATGFDPRPGTHDRRYFAQSFIRTFQPHLLYYFGVAEEEFANVDASDIRIAGVETGYYRKSLKSEMIKGLELIASELENLKANCGESGTASLKGFTSRITNYNPIIKTDKVPEKPTGDAGILKPGHGWVLLGILDANGRVYKDYSNPLVGLYVEENGKKRYVQNIISSNYHQVPAGRYYATISMPAYPQSGITITAGAETNVALRLGRLVLDPRNFDGTAGKQGINVFAITDEPATPGGARLTNSVVTFAGKGGDSLNLAPGRYIVHTGYGMRKIDTITIRSQECTKLTITGAAKFTATKDGVDIRRVVPKSVSLWVALLNNGQDIQLPPGLYEIKLRGSKTGYRLNMESGQAYTYQAP